ncbi:hypothetical protein ATB99_08160 [Elizabethkingia meningoseptica]|uniref:type VI secretion system baseplate subunit TssG n=1 Tax=Elizabethkingia meningoseptica TaxID=238 RepID=UPI000332C6E2|nr:type VI secretion system baseplate subunit TssG [Elizabethkingia meningoseptica]AQX06272.1 hypothetical protein BBD33_13850 [Elizabethkingia meningoseptica]AQX48321.1 hypothetical protein B5G46_13845 [Elizabethkingia meningoseptica]EOR29335.1 hypothetical protein L100_11874 [Elizabethkingia meningoseptica ATCC 13253 = NBRC 12535]KUY16406.1 hypothetical protein ATB99_08160 [Elizabethkingia meningoseptica]MDE5491481.1 type VI secretion system baseplate subunit TssG [Elizabethkingia meningosep
MLETKTPFTEKKYNQLQTDFRVEAVAANIIRFLDPDANILIKRIGLNDRAYLKDIKEINTSYYDLDEENLVIETYREGIYDYLPEGVFHPPSLGNSGPNIDSIVKEIRKQKAVEDHARKFFQPFELEFFYTHVSALLKESEFDAENKRNALLEFASELWPILRKIDSDSAKILVHILPFIHEVRGNKAWIEKFLSAFLKVPVEITFLANIIEAQDDDNGITALGKARLGVTFIPTGRHMDGDLNWMINIGTIPYEDIQRYIPGSPFRELLRELYDFFVPVSVKIFENFITAKDDKSFMLGADNDRDRLGYSTFL